MPLKLVAKRGGSATEVEGRCFFFLEDRFNFWAALEGKMQKRDSKGQVWYNQICWCYFIFLVLENPLVLTEG